MHSYRVLDEVPQQRKHQISLDSISEFWNSGGVIVETQYLNKVSTRQVTTRFEIVRQICTSVARRVMQ